MDTNHRVMWWLMFVVATIASNSQLSFAADVLPQPEPSFKGKITIGAKDSVPAWPQSIAAPQGAPNIVLILLDDIGFADTSTFGGLAQTPELDKLAHQGLRYNNFNTTAMCSPTRAALLTGRNHHRVGFGTITDRAGGYPGYNTIWKQSTASIAEVLRRDGYSTAAFGKWHNTPLWEISPAGPFDLWPTGLGFEYFYGFMNGMESQWNPPLYRNTTPVDPTDRRPAYHFTNDITDEAIAWIRTHESFASQKPYFVYFATAAVHAPHHVPREWINKYRGQFEGGWDRLRHEIFERQKQLGVIPEAAELTPRPAAIPAWNSLSVDERRLFARQMEVYAGFVSHTDHEVGRLIQAVEENPTANNTLIIYIVGDNGSDGTQRDGFTSRGAAVKDQLQDIAELGGPGTINGYAAGWAWLGSTPFQWWKSIASHFGGVRDPMIISWPGHIKDLGALRSQFTHITDVAATLYEVTGIALPSIVDGVRQQPLDGVSFARTFADPNASPSTRTQYFEMLGNRAIYRDGWVAAARHWKPWETLDGSADFRGDQWELYHVSGDFSEMHDLAAQDPEKLKELQQVFDAEARANDVYPLGGASASRPQELSPKQIVYYPSLPRIPTAAAPDFSRSHRITADVTIPEGGAEGVIVCDGSRYYGFTLYIKHDRLVYEANSGRERAVITSDALLPRGHVEFAFDLALDSSPLGTSTHPTELGAHVSGMGQLFINGRRVGEGRLEQMSNPYFGSFNIGQAKLSSVSTAYEIPFKFTGTIEQVKVELR